MHVFVIRYAFIQFCAFLALLLSLDRKKKPYLVFVLCKSYSITNHM